MASDVEQISFSEYADEQRRKNLKKLKRSKKKTVRKTSRSNVIEIISSEDEDVVLVPESERPPPPKATVVAHISPICLDEDDKATPEEDIVEVSFEPAADAENLDEVFLLRYQNDCVVAMHSNNNVKFVCHVCDTTLPNEDRLKQHLKSRLHRKRLNTMKQNQVQPSSSLSKLPQYIKNVGSSSQVWRCVACNCDGLTGRNEVMAHLRNDSHRRNTAITRQRKETPPSPPPPPPPPPFSSPPLPPPLILNDVTDAPAPIVSETPEIPENDWEGEGVLGIKIVSCESIPLEPEEPVQNFSCSACNETIRYKSTWDFHLESLSHRRNVERLAAVQSSPSPTYSTAPSLSLFPLGPTEPSHFPTIVERDPADDSHETSSGAGDSLAAPESPALESLPRSVTSSRTDEDTASSHCSTSDSSEEEFLDKRLYRMRRNRKYKRRDCPTATVAPRPKRRCAEAAQNRIKDMAFLSRLGSKQLTNYHRMMEKTLNGEDPSAIASEDSPCPPAPPLDIVKKEKEKRESRKVLDVQTISDDENDQVDRPAGYASDVAMLQAVYSKDSDSDVHSDSLPGTLIFQKSDVNL